MLRGEDYKRYVIAYMVQNTDTDTADREKLKQKWESIESVYYDSTYTSSQNCIISKICNPKMYEFQVDSPKNYNRKYIIIN